MVYCKEKNYEEAVKTANKVLKVDPNHVKALYRRATAYMCLDKIKKAKKDLIKANELSKGKNKGVKALYKKC
jgi:Flp pilus assembly protein TadD